MNSLKTQDIDVSSLMPDYICYRAETETRYEELLEQLENIRKLLATFVIIGGRPIASFELTSHIT